MVVCPACSAPCETGHRFCFACGGELGEPAPLEDPFIGSTLSGGYRVTHLIGVGGMGRVYGAEQVALGRSVAVKVVHPHLAHDELAAARFLNEARAASRLSHPNSVAIFDFGRTADGHSYIVMEHLRGRDLGRVAEQEGPLPLRRVVDVLRQTLAALEEAHALGILHRDLKPDNVVLEPLRSGLDCVKVVDFGLAKFLESDAPASGGRALTQPGIVCGTPEYMSPEHGRGDPIDGRSDLYAVGIMLFELLAGRVPFSSDSATKTLLMHLTEPAPDPRVVAPNRAIPAPFAELALRALAKSRDDRFQNARAFADALEIAWAQSGGGLSVEPAPATAVHCHACDALNALGQKFCGHCGAPIASMPPPPAAERSRSQQPMSRARSELRTLDRTPAADAGQGTLPLLARDDALAWLQARRHEADAMLAAAHIVGDAGAGKTRLLSHFLARSREQGDFVVCVGPDSTWAKITGAAVRAAIRALADIPAGLSDEGLWEDARPLARSGLSLLFAPSSDVARDAVERRRAVAEALRWALERSGERAGAAHVVLAVEDLDYVDGASRNAFTDVLDEPPVVPALVVVTYAPGTRAAGDPLPGETFALGPLPFESFAENIGDLVPRGTALLPLHLEQLIAWSRETSESAPERLADLLARRADRLSADARHALHAIAIWGDDITAESLRAMLPATAGVEAALDALVCARLVVCGQGTIRIGHPLARRVIFASIPAGRRRELFARAAELRPNAPLEVRARQAMHGGSAFEALALLDEVSALRAREGDLPGSVSALRHALDVARRELHRGELDDPAEAVLVFSRKLAEALAATQDWTGAEGVLREAVGNAPPTSKHRAHLLGLLAHVANVRMHPGEARRYLDEALRAAHQSNARSLIPILERLDKAIAVA
jgi:serine/threonine-protein kinase